MLSCICVSFWFIIFLFFYFFCHPSEQSERPLAQQSQAFIAICSGPFFHLCGVFFCRCKCARVEDSCPFTFRPPRPPPLFGPRVALSLRGQKKLWQKVSACVRLTHGAHWSVRRRGLSEGRGGRGPCLSSASVFTATATGQPAASVEKAQSFRVGALAWILSKTSWPGSPRRSCLLNHLLNVNKYHPTLFCPCNHLRWPRS